MCTWTDSVCNEKSLSLSLLSFLVSLLCHLSSVMPLCVFFLTLFPLIFISLALPQFSKSCRLFVFLTRTLFLSFTFLALTPSHVYTPPGSGWIMMMYRERERERERERVLLLLSSSCAASDTHYYSTYYTNNTSDRRLQVFRSLPMYVCIACTICAFKCFKCSVCVCVCACVCALEGETRAGGALNWGQLINFLVKGG